MSGDSPSAPFAIGENNVAIWKEVASTICYVGKPVKISKDKGVLRIALGSDSLRHVVKDMKDGTQTGGNSTISEDAIIVKKIALLAYCYEEFKTIFDKIQIQSTRESLEKNV